MDDVSEAGPAENYTTGFGMLERQRIGTLLQGVLMRMCGDDDRRSILLVRFRCGWPPASRRERVKK
jgi:hypothetical protein